MRLFSAKKKLLIGSACLLLLIIAGVFIYSGAFVFGRLPRRQPIAQTNTTTLKSGSINSNVQYAKSIAPLPADAAAANSAYNQTNQRANSSSATTTKSVNEVKTSKNTSIVSQLNQKTGL